MENPNWGHPNDEPETLVAKRRTSPVTIDGSLRECAYRGAMRVSFTAPANQEGDRVTYRALWDDEYLYFAANVRDQSVRYDPSRQRFENDSAELSLDPERDRSVSLADDDLHLFGLPKGESVAKRGGADGFEVDNSIALKAEASIRSSGYVLEMRLSWSDLDVRPDVHRRLGLALAVNDLDESSRVQYVWNGPVDLLSPSEWHDLRLGAKRPSDDVPKPNSSDSSWNAGNCSYKKGPQPQYSRTVHLGDEGLSPGDSIDPYLDQYFESGTKVIIPEGTYAWNGRLGGNFDADAALCGKGGAILKAPDGTKHHGTFEAQGDALVRLMNLKLKGVASAGKNRIAFQATGKDARIQIINVSHPDGSPHTGHPAPIGFYVRNDNVGSVLFKNCYIANFPNNGLYITQNEGKVTVDGCVFEGNRVDNLRMSDGDVAKDTLIRMHGGRYGFTAQRGVRFRYPGSIRLENVHIVNDIDSSPVQTATPSRMSGPVQANLKDVFIENNGSSPPIHMQVGGAQAENVHVTGGGNRTPNGVSGDVCTGTNCSKPETSIDKIR